MILSPNRDSDLKKNLGAFYTPPLLASELTNQSMNEAISSQVQRLFGISLSVENLLNSDEKNVLQAISTYLLNFTVLDGSLGQGEFLITSYRSLKEIFESVTMQLTKLGQQATIFPQRRILNNLFGMEIDSGTLNACGENLKEHNWDISKNHILKWIKKNLVEGNFLESNLCSWEHLPENFQGFDLIIGNPPWGSQLTKEEKAYYHKKFNLSGSKRNLNSFELFVYQSTNLLKPNGGYLALYLPKNLVRSNQYVNLRKFILTNYQLKSLVFHDLFVNVTQEFISLIAHFTEEEKTSNKLHVNQLGEILQNVYLTNTDYIFTNLTDKTSFQLLNLIKKNTKTLEEYVTIQRGEELSKRGGIMYCNLCTSWVPLSSRKPNIECPQCHEVLNKTDLQAQFLISPSKSSEHKIPILTGDDFDQYLINSTHYFNDLIKFKSKKNTDIYQSPKIVLQKIKRFPCATIDLNNTLTTQNVYNIRLKEQWQKHPKYLYYILAILNSHLMNWYYENQFNLGSKYTNAISIKNLKRLPIRPPEKNEKTVETIERKIRNLYTSETLSNSWKEEIDNLIYRVYNCSAINENFKI